MPLTKAEVARLRALRDARNRQQTGRYIVEGPKVIGELLAAGHRFEDVFATEAWRPQSADAVERVTTVSAAEMGRISHFPTPSCVLAVGRIERASLQAGELDAGLTLALDGIQDPGNVGTLLRIADWFGFQRVLLSPECADLFSQKVINASMGSFARVRVVTTDLPSALAATATPAWGCDLQGKPWHELVAPPACIVVVGSEGRGLSPAVAARLARRITIPRSGQAESLNAAVAAGIICAQLRRPN